MHGAEACKTCGKKVRSGSSGSMTQWMFSESACKCGVPPDGVASEPGEAPERSEVCPQCRKLKGDSRDGSLTHWVFGETRCRCNRVPADGTVSSGSQHRVSGRFKAELPDELVAELESDRIDYHGLPPDSFPFERYRIVRETGRGNGGIVYESWDCSLKKRVAIKTLYHDTWNADDIIRFQQEAKSASRLHHPNVLQVLDFGASPGGQPYMVMEFVDGLTLKDLIEKEESLPENVTLPIFLQICQGLHHAHEQGILHRDLKSNNIMISRFNSDEINVKIIDFGIAAMAQSTTLSPSGSQTITVVGTPHYMSPDQINGFKYDERSDIYSIGVMLCEALTGRLPFQSDNTMAVLALHATAEVPDLEELNDQVEYSDQIKLTVHGCLEKDREKRFAGVTELQKSLEECLEQSSSASDPGEEPGKKTNFFEGSLIAATVLLIGAISLSLVAPFVNQGTKEQDRKKARSKTRSMLSDDKMVLRSALLSGSEFTTDALKGFQIKNDGGGEDRYVASKNVADQDLKKLIGLNVRSLRLEYNNTVTEKGYSTIAKLPLQVLYLTGTKLDAGSIESLSKSHTITALELNESQISDAKIRLLKPLKLRWLALRHCSGVTDAGLKFIADNYPHMYQVDVSYTSVTPAGLVALSGMPHLHSLSLGGLDITDKAVAKYLQPLSSLRSLNLEDNPISDESLDLLSRMNLQNIFLNDCPNITGQKISQITQRTRIKITSTAFNGQSDKDVTDEIVDMINPLDF